MLTQLGMVYGTPEYMAPEQALGQAVDARADLYALGVMMFEMIAGARPYEHESKVTLLGMHVTAPIPKMADRAPDANVPPEVEAIVTRLLAKEAAARFADAKELVEALDAVSAQLAARRAHRRAAAAACRGAARDAGVGAARRRRRANAALALSPTSLANPVVTGARGRLASLVGASLNQALRSAPPWMTPQAGDASRRRRWARCSSALVVVGALVARRSGDRGLRGRQQREPPAPPRPPDPKTDDLVATAQSKIDKGDFATAIDALTAVEKAGPDRADVHQLLERAYTGVRNSREAMREAGLWLAADANASADPKLQEDVRNAALFRDAQDDAFALLESKMGAAGHRHPLRHRLRRVRQAVPAGGDARAPLARRATTSASARARRSPCSSTFATPRRATRSARCSTARATTATRGCCSSCSRTSATRGCGFLGRSDCYPCMHKDTALRDAMSAIERARQQAQP